MYAPRPTIIGWKEANWKESCDWILERSHSFRLRLYAGRDDEERKTAGRGALPGRLVLVKIRLTALDLWHELVRVNAASGAQRTDGERKAKTAL